MQHVRGNDVAMIFQDPMTSLNPTWTIGRQIAEAYRLHNDTTQREAMLRAREVLELVGLPRPAERLAAYPHQLSGGLRQRVMVAMALVNSPKLLIADEPTTALDVTIQAQILDLIDNLRRDFEMAVILITHDLGVIAARADRVMVMYAGKIVEGSETEQLFGSMRHPYTEALFRSIPRFDQDRSQALFSIPGVPPDLMYPPPGCRFAPRCRNAQPRCTQEEPLLAPETDDGSRPGAGVEHTETPTLPHAIRSGEHVYACFYPVGTSSDQTTLQSEQDASPLALGLVDADAGNGAAPPISVTEPSAFAGRAREPTARSCSSSTTSTRSSPSPPARSCSARSERSRPCRACPSRSTAGRRSGSSESRAAGRRRSAGSSPLWTGSRRAKSVSRARTSRASADARSAARGATASSCSRIRTRRSTRACASGRRSRSRSTSSRSAPVATAGSASPSSSPRWGCHRSRPGSTHTSSREGQRQRIGLARALALNPKLIVADEPVSALDVSIQAQILNLMRSLQDSHELTYIVISHDLAVVRYLADTIGVMYLGKLVEIGPASRGLRASGAPVHARADRRGADSRSRAREAARDGGRPRRAALGDRTAVGLPLPHPVPDRSGSLRGNRASPPLLRRPPPRRMPLPARDS